MKRISLIFSLLFDLGMRILPISKIASHQLLLDVLYSFVLISSCWSTL